jgi:hypothetical protein
MPRPAFARGVGLLLCRAETNAIRPPSRWTYHSEPPSQFPPLVLNWNGCFGNYEEEDRKERFFPGDQAARRRANVESKKEEPAACSPAHGPPSIPRRLLLDVVHGDLLPGGSSALRTKHHDLAEKMLLRFLT